jgi:hypothetical protein
MSFPVSKKRGALLANHGSEVIIILPVSPFLLFGKNIFAGILLVRDTQHLV